jgi:hypothetical protein
MIKNKVLCINAPLTIWFNWKKPTAALAITLGQSPVGRRTRGIEIIPEGIIQVHVLLYLMPFLLGSVLP